MAENYAQSNADIVAALMAQGSPEFTTPSVDPVPGQSAGGVVGGIQGGNTASRLGHLAGQFVEGMSQPMGVIPSAPKSTNVSQASAKNLHLMQQQQQTPASLRRAELEHALAMQDYGNTVTRRFRGGILGLGELVYDKIKHKDAYATAGRTQAKLNEEQRNLQNTLIQERQDERFNIALPVVAAVNPSGITGRNPDGSPTYSPEAIAMARLYATGDMTPDQLAKASFEQAIGMEKDANGYQRYTTGEKAGQRVFPNVTIDPDQKNILATETGYRKEFNALTSKFRTTDLAHRKLQAAFNQPGAAGSLGMIFSIMNILDPGVSVREDDYRNVESTRGMTAELKNWWNKANTGDGLTPDQRKELMDLGTNLYAESYADAMQRATDYTQIAVANGVDPRNVITTFLSSSVPATPKANLFTTPEQADAAFQGGIIKDGDTVFIAGQEFIYHADPQPGGAQ